MHDDARPTAPDRARGTRVLAAVLVTAALVTGCGGGSASPTARTLGSTPASSSSHTATRAPSTAPGAYRSGPLAFARCMRANGVPNFPDPQPGSGALFNPAGINPAAPAVQTATSRCQKLLNTAGGPAPLGSTTHPAERTLAKLLAIADCMRQHGVPEFPDPRTSVPLHPFGGGTGLITDYDGAILLFPSTLDTHAPAYTHAAAACGTLAQKLATGPHG
jgi:hypothetical protein